MSAIRVRFENDADITLIPVSAVVFGVSFVAGLAMAFVWWDGEAALRVIEARDNVRAACIAGNANACKLYEVDYAR